MKTTTLTLTAALVALSQSAWACPNLDGKYLCVLPHSTAPLAIHGFEQNGIPSYTIDGADSSYQQVTDNQWRAAPPELSLGMDNAQIRSSCSGEVLRIELHGTQQISGADILMVRQLSLDADGNLRQQSKTSAAGLPVPTTELDCDRQAR